MTARACHRRMDRAALEAEARDGGLAGAPADLYRPRRIFTKDLSMSRPHEPRVLFMQLAERTSGKGTRYLSGWCGKCRLVGFLSDETDRDGNPLWNIYAQEPRPDPGDGRGRGAARA